MSLFFPWHSRVLTAPCPVPLVPQSLIPTKPQVPFLRLMCPTAAKHCCGGGRLCFQHSMVPRVPLWLDSTTLVPTATSVWVLPLLPSTSAATSSAWMQQGDRQPLQLLLGRDTPVSSSSSPKARGCGAQLPCVNGARPWAGSCAAPWWHRARRPGLAPSIDSPANDRECDQGQEQAAQGPSTASTRTAGRQGRGGPCRGQGDVNGW